MAHGAALGLIALAICHAAAFNLEPRLPVIKRGARDSYFGFSVAEHQQIDETEHNLHAKPKSWILVGAPLDQNIQPQTNHSGALWKCPLTTNTSDCTQVITDGILEVDQDVLNPPQNDEIKDGQWLGVTVHSQGKGGKVMVCAHRHIVKTADSRWGQGQCYILTQDFTYMDLKKPCSGKPTNKAHEQFGFCQAGTSGMLTSEDRVVIGTPGPHTWKGTIYLFTVSDEFLNRDNTVYNIPMQETSPVKKYSYLGMSVTVGYFFGSKFLSYAAGAPRSNGTGQVILLTRHDNIQDLEVVMTLDGEQFASSFGYQIASADVNGDKVTDLIVSAPFYFKKSEGGAVYIYTNLCKSHKDQLHDEKCKPTKLVGRQESRFGFALANLGDLNKDSFEDIAIGAPYEGKGTVYIYLGSKKGIITTPSQVIHSEDTPVPLSTFGYSLSGGLDMDNNGYPDLLIGAYDDAAVALLMARKIINITTSIRYMKRYRTYQERIDPIDPNSTGCSGDPNSNLTCVTFEVCCSTHMFAKTNEIRSLTLNYFIEAETYSGSKKFSRVWFGEGGTRQHFVNRVIELGQSPGHCQPETVYLKENTRDIQSPIKFRVNFTLIQREPVMAREGDPLPDINHFPILNQQEATRIFEVTFQKDCGNNDFCETDLIVDAALNLSVSATKPNFYELLLGEREEVIVDTSVLNVGESAYEAQLFIIHSASLSYIASKSNESVTCNLFNRTTVACSIGNPFKKDKAVNIQVRFDPKGLEDSESQLKFLVFANSTSWEVQQKNPIQLYATVLKRAELSIKGTAKSQHEFYGGPIVGESAMTHLNEVGPKVSHIYQVFNEGPWRVSILEVKISWPYEVMSDKSEGKWLLYLEDVPTVQGDGECVLPSGHVANPLKLQSSVGLDDIDSTFTPKPAAYTMSNRTAKFIRSRRDTEKVVNTRTIIDKDGRKRQVVSMNCKAGTAKCFDIICTIYNLQRKREATIAITARLWNSTLVEDYPRVDMVRIGSSAEIIIPPHVVIQQENHSDDFTIAETIARPDLQDQQEAEPVPIWIIIVAIIAGLTLLILLTLLLWKLGFFKRRRPDPTLSGNLEKHREDIPENEALFKN